MLTVRALVGGGDDPVLLAHVADPLPHGRDLDVVDAPAPRVERPQAWLVLSGVAGVRPLLELGRRQHPHLLERRCDLGTDLVRQRPLEQPLQCDVLAPLVPQLRRVLEVP